MNKRCRSCNQIKPISEFHKNRSKNDGHHDHCKICKNKSHRNYKHTPKGKAAQKRYYDSTKGKLTHRKYNIDYHIKHPERNKAVTAVNHAIRAGKLPRPDSLQCHYCNNQAKQYHHWQGYAPEHWLDVVPICISCHRNIDKRIA